jgi:hypothetical protein
MRKAVEWQKEASGEAKRKLEGTEARDGMFVKVVGDTWFCPQRVSAS